MDVDRKILGATLATAHKIIYQPTVEDAETVAKEFASRPDPARVEILENEWVEELEKEWVEELEKEWVEEIAPESIEILKDEYEDRTMDEWEDGIEPVMTVSQSPLDLLADGHTSERVSLLISQFLKPLDQAQEVAKLEGVPYRITMRNQALDLARDQKMPYVVTAENKLSYATQSQLMNGKELINQLLVDLMRERLSSESQECIDRMVAIAEELCLYIPFTSGTQTGNFHRYYHERNSNNWKFREDLRSSLEELTTAVIDRANSKLYSREDTESEQAFTQAIEDFQTNILYLGDIADENKSYHFQNAWEEAKSKGLLLPPGPPAYFTNKTEEEKTTWLEEYNKIYRQARERANTETQDLVEFLAKLYALCIELSKPENRVMVQSGQYQPRKHQQPHYTQHSRLALNHPRKELMHPRRELNHPRRDLNHPRLELSHPQRSIADMVAEKELDLLDLANYTGYYKLTSKQGTEKGKLIARKLPEENHRLMSRNLTEHILANTYRDYCVEREEIEKAIKKRQEKTMNNQSASTKKQRGNKEQDDDAPQRRG